MKLIDLKRIIDEAVIRAGDTAPHVSVEVWFKKRMYRIGRISQFGVVPDLVIEIGEKVLDMETQFVGDFEVTK